MRRFFALVKELLDAGLVKYRALPWWLNYALAAILIAAIVGLGVWRWGLRQQVDVGLVARNANVEPRVENLWFLPNGALVGTQYDTQGKLIVLIWETPDQMLGNNPTERRVFDLDRYLFNIEKEQHQQDPKTFDERARLPFYYAIARDGSEIAVFYFGRLFIFNPYYSEPVHEIDFGSKIEFLPTALSFTDDRRIALAYAGGRVELRDPTNLRQTIGSAETKLDKPSIMKPFGNFLAVVSTARAAVVVMDLLLTKERPAQGYRGSLPQDFTLAISPKGALAIGTGQSNVVVTQPDGAGEGKILQAYGPVRIVSFFDENRVLVGGDFQNIYLLSPDQPLYTVAVAPQGVNAMAVNGNRIAYSGGKDGVFLMWHKKRYLPNLPGKIVLILYGLFLVGLVSFGIYDNRKRREDIVAETPVEPASTISTLPVPDPPQDLVVACSKGEAVLYAGAGLSAQSGFPTWPTFVERLMKWAIANGFIEQGLASSLRAAIEQSQYDAVADNVVSAMRGSEDLLNDYLKDVFFVKTAFASSTHKILREIQFSSVLTTNFDRLLENTFEDEITSSVYTPKDAEQLLQCLTKHEFFLLKLYGTLERPDTVMIAPAQYDDAVKGNLPFSRFMETLFFSRTLFFVGSSLEGIEAYLKGISLGRQNRINHYALVSVADEAWQAKAKPLKERYGIEVLPYFGGSDFAGLPTFLKVLKERVAAEMERTKDEAAPSTVLRKIKLTDVGPFDNLEIDFDRHWNILLGDNGVGKSTVIKAIAVAIVGDDARSFAVRIIKSGKTNGSITLVTGRNTYTTKIFRSNGDARVESVPGRPFEAEGWLAIGFPPLRTVSWTRPKAAESETKGRPMADDLIPVITGEPDPRLDKLKQWIVNIDYWIKDAKSRQADSTRYERLLNEFFKVVTDLTEGVKIEFKEVKPQTNEVTIVTDDGELPIEALSQGTTSLIGWVGILLQRLYEVYGDDEDPKTRYALVLMDEIDAHLHPAWQRSLTRNLKKIFPNVQFIATTHSPLIIGGMQPEQIMRFARDDENNVVIYKVEEEMLIGRADQILTSDLFGLKSTFSLNDKLEVVMAQYHELLAKDRTPDEEIKFQRLRESLKTRIPLESESPPEQKATALLRELVKAQGDGRYESVDQRTLDLAERLLNEVSKKKK